MFQIVKKGKIKHIMQTRKDKLSIGVKTVKLKYSQTNKLIYFVFTFMLSSLFNVCSAFKFSVWKNLFVCLVQNFKFFWFW